MITDSMDSGTALPHTPDNGKTSRKQWWEHLPIPASWWMESNLPPSSAPPYRDRGSENLDDTWSRYNQQRRYDDSPPPSPKIQVPFSVIVTVTIYLVGQLVAGVWWAANQESNLQHEISDRQKEEARLWDGIQSYRSEVNALRLDIARLTGNRSNYNKQKEED